MAWPTSIAGNGDLYEAKNNISTTLNGAIDNVTTTVVLTDASAFPASGFVTIGTEAISYTSKTGNSLNGVVRGADGTTAASHLDGSGASHYVVAAHHNALKDEVIAIETQLAAEMTATKEPTGFPDASTTTISVVDGTRTFTIAPTGASFDVYVAGKKFTKTSESVSFTDTEGVWYFSYDSTGTLTASQTMWDLALAAPVSLLYWNATDNVSLDLADERHGSAMDWATHKYLHTTVGTRFVDGLAASGYVLNSAVDADVRFAFSSGHISDEDLLITIAAQTEPAQIPVFYRAGATGLWKRAAATDYPYLTTGTGRIAYNLDTAGTWSQAEVSNGDFAAYWIFATDGKNFPIVSIQGQRLDTSLANAQNNNLYESLSFGTLPYAEMKLLYRVIVRTSNAYGSTMKVRVVDVQDLRSVSNLPSGSYVATDHGSLSGRTAAGSHPAEAITVTPAGNIASTDVGAALNELDTEKLALSGGTLSGALLLPAGSATTPAVAFSSDSNTGVFSGGTDILAVSTAGVARAGFISDGTLIVTDTPADLSISSGTAAGSVVSGHNRFFRSVNSAHTGTIRLLGINNANSVVVGGEPSNTPVILNAGSGHVRMDNASQLTWRNAADNADLRVFDVDSGNNLNIGRDDAVGDIQLFGRIVIYDDAASPAEKFRVESSGNIVAPSVYSNTDASAANVYVDSSGNLKRSTASAGGSGTVANSTLDNKLAYYDTAGTTVSPNNAITVGDSGGIHCLATALDAPMSFQITAGPRGTATSYVTAQGSDTINGGDAFTLYSSNQHGTGVSLNYSVGMDTSNGGALVMGLGTPGVSDTLVLSQARQIFTGIAGTVSAPVFCVNNDANTGIYAPAADEWAVARGGSVGIHLKASTTAGTSFGIGCDPSSSYALDIVQARAATTVNARVRNNSTTAGSHAVLTVESDSSTTGDAAINVWSGSAADAWVYFSAGDNWTVGVDYSDSNSFKVSNSFAPGTNDYLRIAQSNGYLRCIGVYSQTTASAANVYVDSSGNLMRSTSSLRYKTNIQEVPLESATKLLDLTPVTYASMCEADDKTERHYGFIAEELDLLDPVLVNYKTLEDGTKVPDGVQYERVVVGLLKLVQDLTKRVADLEAKVAKPCTDPSTTIADNTTPAADSTSSSL